MSKYCHSCALNSLTYIFNKYYEKYELVSDLQSHSFELIVEDKVYPISVKLRTIDINGVSYLFGSFEYLLYLLDSNVNPKSVHKI